MIGNIDPHISPDLHFLSVFGSSSLRLAFHKSFLLPLSIWSLVATQESTFPKVPHLKMINFKGKHVLNFTIIITVVPLLINVVSSDIYNELVKYSSLGVRLGMITIALVFFGVVSRVFIEVHHCGDNVSLLPLTWQPERSVQLTRQILPEILPEPLVTRSLGPQVTGRPYSPFIDPQVRHMVDSAASYVNERWGVGETVEFMTARLHTKEPVTDVEAAMHSILTLSGSKVLLRRLEIGPRAGNSEIDQLSAEISEAMRLAREIDEDCTLQLGSFAMCKYTDGCLKWWRLEKQWIPTISAVCRRRNLWDLLKGRSAKWCIRGFNLQRATLKVSTTDESETLAVFNHYRTKSGEDVLLCGEPCLVVQVDAKFHKAIYMYALNSVEIEGVTVDVQSNPKDIPRAYWSSVVQSLRKRPWTLIAMASTLIMLAVFILNITYGGYDGLITKATSISLPHHHSQRNGDVFIFYQSPRSSEETSEDNSILSLFLQELPFFFLTFTCLMLISITSALRRLIKDQPLGHYARCLGRIPALKGKASARTCPSSPPAEDNLLEDLASISVTPTSLEESFSDESFDSDPGPQTTNPTEDFSNPNPVSSLCNDSDLTLEDVSAEIQEETEGYGVLDSGSTSPLDVYFESSERKAIPATQDLVCYRQFGSRTTLEKLMRYVLELSLSDSERHRSPWRLKKSRLLDASARSGVVVIRLLGKEVLPVVQLQTIKCLADRAQYSQFNQEKIASLHGVLDSLTSHLQDDSTLVQEHTARCLANLAQTKVNHMKMASSTVLDSFVKLLANDAVLPPVHEQAARCLTNLAMTKDFIKERIANYPGLLDALVIQLQKHRTSRVQRLTMECLTNLASLQEVQLKIVSDYSVVLDALVRSLGVSRTSDVQLQSLKCLISLSNHYQGNQVAIASHSGVLDALLRFLRYNWITTNRINVQVEAAKCLLKLLQARANLLKIASYEGLFDTLARCLEPSRRIHEVQNSAVKCFSLLAAAPENALKIVSCPGIVSAIVNLIGQVENPTGQSELAAWCLNELSKPRETKVLLTSHPGLLRSLVVVLNDSNSAVLEPAIKCLLKFTQSDEPDVQVNINSHGPCIIDSLLRVLGRNGEVTLLEGKEDTADRLSDLVLACYNADVIDFSDLSLLGTNIDVSILMHAAKCLSYLAQEKANQSYIASYPGVYDALRKLSDEDKNSRAQSQTELCLANSKPSTDLAEGDDKMTSGQLTDLQGKRFRSGDNAPYDWFEDPITFDTMCDPVKCSDGVTYDRWTIINNGIEKSPFNRTLTKFCIVCDDIDARRRLFHTFPHQEIQFRELRESYRQKALQSARDLDPDDAVEKLNHVLTWAPADRQCRNELDSILKVRTEPSSFFSFFDK